MLKKKVLKNKMLIDKTPEVNSFEKKLKHFDILHSEASVVREQDKFLVRSLFENFSQKELTVGIGFQRAYGSVLSGDYFDLINLPDGRLMFVFTDVSGHGLPAYTTLIRLRSAITLAVKEAKRVYELRRTIDTAALVNDISAKFTDIMDESNSDDFACMIFTFISNSDDGRYLLKIYNRGMLFPIVLKRPRSDIQLVNLNYPERGWEPKRGFYLGKNIHKLLGERYFDVPELTYFIDRGDSIFFYSDGISEAYNAKGSEEFGDRRIEDVLRDYAGLFPHVIVDELFRNVYSFIGSPEGQKDDMTAVLIGFPSDIK
ncbi:MAG: serine/threonine-protein phosphatase [Spirochaetia bacterium]|nr:serine/threonine-protein phosphatase [Spirochaetia bacterium]